MNIKIASNEKELDDVIYLRKTVFVEEQHVPIEIELDGFDHDAIHIIGYTDDQPISASRLRFIEDFGKLERICVLADHRGQSYGKNMIQFMENEIQKYGFSKAKLNAQSHAREFYELLGYDVVSEKFIDAGIPHIAMIKDL